MSISEPFIRRPVATTLLTLGLLLAGAAGYRQLPVSALPQVEFPTIVVSTLLPGASAETMTSSVTTPLERQLGQVPSLSQMVSLSSFGTSQITLQFALERDIDAAEQDVQAAINAAATLLPRTLPNPPTYSKANPADVPVLTLAVTSDALPLDQVADQADSILAQKISQVSGVGLVALSGGVRPAVRVQVDPAALAGRGLTLEDVRAAIVAANVNQPKGNLDGPRLDYTLSSNDQLVEAADYRDVILAYRNGAPIRLRDVGDAADSVENAQLAAWSGPKRAILLSVQRQPGANVIAVADKVKDLLPRLKATLPPGLEVAILSDRTETVRASVLDVQLTLLLTVVLVVAVMFLFLRSLRATLIPGVAVPLSIVATFGGMFLAGFSLNNLSLMALTISTGFVVDDAIVMVENVARFIEAGERPFDAALKGAKQIGFTIVSLTVSLVAVLIPLLFMGGIIGRLFREFAVTLAIAIGVSALLSLTLTAMMAAHLLKPRGEEREGRFARALDRGFARLVQTYARALDWVLERQPLALGATLAALALTLALAVLIPKGFFPVQDTGQILGITEAAPDVSFSRLSELQERLNAAVLEDPAVASVASSIGADGTNPTPNAGRLSINLKPQGERAGVQEVIDRLRGRLSTVGGIAAYLQPVQDLQVEARVGRTQYQYTLDDPDPAELARQAPRVVAALRTLPELREVASDLSGTGLGLRLEIDRDRAARVGVLPQAVDDELYDAFGQRQISTIFTQLNQYRVILEVKPEYRENPLTLQRLFARTSAGGAVPLLGLATAELAPSALAVSHQGQFPSATVSFDTAPGVALGAAVEAIRRAEAPLSLPAGLRASFSGTAQAFQESLASEPLLIVAALLTVYIVLGVLYESYIHPVTILSTLPSAGLGALVALIAARMPFSIVALIGAVLLIGIVKKNGIMMVDFALEAERDEGLAPRAAIRKASLLRFRPIMMTTMAALLGGLPLALGRGTGSELRRPLGVSIVGGLVVSQVLTLFTTPVIYLFMSRLGRRREASP